MNATHDDDFVDGDPGRLVRLVNASTEFEARTIIAVLESYDIRAFAFAGTLPSFGFADPALGISKPVPVQVAAADLERAREALRDAKEVGASVDWDSVDVGEPEPERGVFRSLLEAAASPRFLTLFLGAIAICSIVVLAVIVSMRGR